MIISGVFRQIRLFLKKTGLCPLLWNLGSSVTYDLLI